MGRRGSRHVIVIQAMVISQILIRHHELVNRYGISVSQTYHRIFLNFTKSNTMDATSGTLITYPAGTPEFTIGLFVGFALLNLEFSMSFLTPFS
jgi:hypothetical protein